MKLTWTRRARRAFASALDYLDERNPAASSRIEAKILAAVSHIHEYPKANRAGRVTGTRELVVHGTPYLVVYRIGKTEITILHVLHTKQDWPSQ